MKERCEVRVTCLTFTLIFSTVEYATLFSSKSFLLPLIWWKLFGEDDHLFRRKSTADINGSFCYVQLVELFQTPIWTLCPPNKSTSFSDYLFTKQTKQIIWRIILFFPSDRNKETFIFLFWVYPQVYPHLGI